MHSFVNVYIGRTPRSGALYAVLVTLYLMVKASKDDERSSESFQK